MLVGWFFHLAFGAGRASWPCEGGSGTKRPFAWCTAIRVKVSNSINQLNTWSEKYVFSTSSKIANAALDGQNSGQFVIKRHMDKLWLWLLSNYINWLAEVFHFVQQYPQKFCAPNNKARLASIFCEPSRAGCNLILRKPRWSFQEKMPRKFCGECWRFVIRC